MSWEEFKKKKEQKSSWQEFKSQKQNKVQYTPKKQETSLWQNIQNLAGDIGKSTQNLFLGASSGTKQSFNYGLKTAESKYKTEQRAKNERVLSSKELSNSDKAIYIAGTLQNHKKNNIQDVNLPTIKSIVGEGKEKYDKEKVEGIANKNILDKSIEKDQKKIQENINAQTNNVTKKLAELAPSIGNMGVGAALSAVNPALGTAYFTTSAGGSYIQDAEERGMTRKDAITYGSIMGLMEGATEAIGWENLSKAGKGLKTLIKGTGKTLAKEGVEQVTKNSIKTILKDYGVGIAENAIQELLIEPIQEITAGAVAGKDKANWSDIGQRMLKSGIDGGLTSAIVGGANLGIQSCVGVVEKTQKGQGITTQELQIAVKDASKKLDVEKMITDSTQQQIQKYKRQQNQQIPTKQEAIPIQPKNVQNPNNKPVLPIQRYVYEKSDNVKIDNFRKSASNYFDNSEKTRNYINMLEKIITDKDIDIRFDANLKDSQGRVANGSYASGVITINPNSNRAGEFIAIHELTHAIGTKQMQNIVEQYRKSNTEFNTAVEQLLKNYNTAELTEEAMADVSAQLFGNQEFINNLAQTEPSLFRKIYNEIKYLWHQFTGYSNQNQFIEDLQYKWEQAYRNNAKLNETTNYYIEPVAKFDETEYNNIIEEKLGKQEYAILRNIINSDSNIKPGINYVEVTNGRYTVYYKGFDDFKVMSRKVDADAGRINKRNDTTGRKTRYSKTFEQSIGNEGTTTSNDEVSNFNSPGTRERSGSNSSSSTNIKNDINLPTQESENNSGSFNLPKLKEGHTRLYRGLENEYDANYDKTKLDNSNGYESWTDNYELAKAYGNNVYYIDVPSNEIKNTIIDENSKSETYGDRNLLYKNDKPVGIKNKSGNEYMLYTDHDNYSNLKYNKVNNTTPMQDNKGRTLSKEQQEYFKDSKARDKNGNLLEVYHGTSEDFTEFDISYLGSASGDVGFLGDGFYLATHKGEAKYYGNKIMNGYVNIKNPYNIKDLSKYNGKIFNGEDSSSGLHIKNLIELNPQWRNIEINNTTYGEIADEVTNYLENVKIKKLGIVEDSYGNDSGIMWEISFNGKKTQDESILNYTEEEMIANGLNKHIRNQFGHINNSEIIQYITEENRFNKSIKTLREVLQEKGYDSIVQGTPQDTDEIVIFDSNQFKNVDNAKPTSNPDIRYSLPTKEWQQYLDENYKAIGTRTNLKDIRLPVKENSTKSSFNLPTNNNNTETTATILEKPAEKVEEKDRTLAIIKANLIDKGMVFEELSIKANNRELQAKWDYTLSSTARGQNAIGNARYELNPNTKTQKQISKSLTDIIDEVGENTSDFYAYMYHQLNIDRMTLEERFGGDTGINYERRKPVMNKPVFGESVTAQMSRQKVAELEKKYPEFKEYAQDVYDYLDANTKELVDNGVISKETQELFKEMYPHYVPISRIRNKGQAINVPLDTGRTGINNPIKKATGGSSDISPLFETMADRTLQTYRATARNSFGVELKNTLNQTNQVSKQTDIDTIMENMTDEEQNKQLLQEGKNGENPTFTVFENGNKVTYEINKDMYDALKPKNELLAKIDDSKASKVANKINNFRRGLLTEYNPVFSITNAIKDAQDVLLNSQHSAKTYAKIPEATAQLLSKGYWYNEYVQNGGEQNSYFKDGEFETTKNNLPTKIKNTITFPLQAISNVNNVIEMTPRLAEYIASREAGRSIETSMLDAARVTTNFKAGGDITKTLNRNGFTFLNASVQGMQQQIRNIQEASAKGLKGYAVLACKYAIAGVPVLLLNNLIWADDDDYDELQDYVKDNYYIIGKLPNGKFLRIPKGRAVATIQKIVSNANDFIKNDIINPDEVGKVFWEDMKENLQFGIDNLAPNNPIENNILSPLFQAITNKTWYGEDLVPSRLQKKPSEEQYDESTDSFSRWLGEKTGISPIKINYLIDQYSGGAGDVLLPMMTPQAENNVVEDKFTTDSVMKSKYPGEFFSKVDELEIDSNSSKATDEDIIKYKYISSASVDIGKLYKEKRDIQNSNATDEKKKSQLKEVQKRINKLAKNSLENIDKIIQGEKYAQIDTSQYYKNIEGEWQKLEDKDKEKNKKSELSLKTYSSYKYEMSKIKRQKISKGEMTKEQSLKNDDKIQILLDSNYSDKEKIAIYENYIKTQTKEGEYDSFDVIKASNIDIDEYLKYEQQEFTSDKKDDGTLTGKTVSKSKQKKVVEYLNSMNIKGNQRLLLYAMQGYSMTAAQKAQVANYVKELKIDNDTKLKLYDKFSGFTVYKDGSVKW